MNLSFCGCIVYPNINKFLNESKIESHNVGNGLPIKEQCQLWTLLYSTSLDRQLSRLRWTRTWPRNFLNYSAQPNSFHNYNQGLGLSYECSYGKNQHSSGATSGYLMASLLLTSEAAPTDLLTDVIPPLAAGVAVVDDNVLLLWILLFSSRQTHTGWLDSKGRLPACFSCFSTLHAFFHSWKSKATTKYRPSSSTCTFFSLDW